MSEKMRAAVLVKPGEMRLETRDIPEPGRDEVLVQVKAVGICGSDAHCFRSGKVGDHVVKRPLVLGHETAGIIVATGEGVRDAQKDQRVSVEPGWPCSRCSYCKAGKYNQCPNGRFLATPPNDGALCDYLVAPADFVHPLPEKMSFAEGALIEPLAVGVHACRQGELRLGDTVLVSGGGAIGLCCAMAAFGLGAARVFLSEPNPFRREMAREFGATGVFDPASRDAATIMQQVMGEGAHVILEASGADSAIQQSIELIRSGGRIVLVASAHKDVVPLNITHLMFHEAEIRTVWRYANDFPLAIHLIESGKAPVGRLITHRYAIENIQQAMEETNLPNRMKSVVEL